jgi:hypothetical protein
MGMGKPVAKRLAIAFLALGSMSVYAGASDSAAAADSAAPAVLEIRLPDFAPVVGDFFPDSAARKLMQGSAGMEFQIDGEGHVQIMGETFADQPDFAASAAEFLKKGRFRVGSNWVEIGGPTVRFYAEIQFVISRGGSDCAKKPPRTPDTEVIVVCRSQPSRRSGRL